MKKIIQRILMAALALTVALPVSAVPVSAETSASSDNESFEKYMSQEFVDAMNNTDYMTQAYQVKDLESYGITQADPNDGFKELIDPQAAEKTEASLKKLKEFDYATLSTRQQHDYDVYLNELQLEQEQEQLQDYKNYWDGSSGLQSNLVTNFEEFPFRTAEDFDAYVIMITKVGDYLDQAVAFTEKQAATGYFMTDSALDSVEEQIDSFTSKTTDNELIISFSDQVDQFDGLTDAEKADYKQKVSDAVQQDMIPAFQKTRDALEKLRGSRKVDGGLSGFDKGKEYYSYLTRSESSTELSVEDLMDLTGSAIKGAVSDYSDLYEKYGSDKETGTLSIGDADANLKYLKSHMDEVPTGPDLSYKVSYLDESIANPNIVAYYVNPAIDDFGDNVIKVNGSNIDDSISLYETLAHEGFPGHCYQITWYLASSPNPIRTFISNLGYTEGWAMYSETMAIKRSGLDEYSQEMSTINNIIGYCIGAYADLGVNGLGWDEKELESKFEDLGLNSDLADSTYQDALDTPGRLMAYGCGMAWMLALRDKAETALGSKFDEAAYNEVVLENGPRDYELVSSDVDAFIEANGGDLSAYTGWGSEAAKSAATSQSKKGDYTWILIAGFAAVGVIAFLAVRRSHQKNPFEG